MQEAVQERSTVVAERRTAIRVHLKLVSIGCLATVQRHHALNFGALTTNRL